MPWCCGLGKVRRCIFSGRMPISNAAARRLDHADACFCFLFFFFLLSPESWLETIAAPAVQGCIDPARCGVGAYGTISEALTAISATPSRTAASHRDGDIGSAPNGTTRKRCTRETIQSLAGSTNESRWPQTSLMASQLLDKCGMSSVTDATVTEWVVAIHPVSTVCVTLQ